jgi:hypothetical protein
MALTTQFSISSTAALEGMKDGLRMSNWGYWRADLGGGCAGGRRNTSVVEDGG